MGMKSITGILLFDGFCVLCSGFVRQLMKKFDASLQVIPMQSTQGRVWLRQYGLEAETDEVILLVDNRPLKGVTAILFLMQHAGGWWKLAGKVSACLPDALLAWFYRRIANNRYLWFGKRTTCYRPLR
jgi:predicted DCC family thiol-disulfide oxidoreductase YuxK